MFKKLVLLFLTGAVLLGGAACEHKKTTAEFKAEKEKAFRDKQKVAAIKAYQDLVNKYPDSEFAPKAQERLSALGPPPATPVPAKKK